MKFRYKLAKETFKNKKIPPKKVPGEDSISADQRGDDTSWSDSQLLSLDKETKRVEPTVENPKEVSRRDLFSFGRLTDFADAVEEEEKKLPKKKKTKPETEEPENSEAPPVDSPSEGISAEEVPTPEPEKKKGFFRRMASKFRPGSKDEPSESEIPLETSSDAIEEAAVDEPAPVDLPPHRETIFGIPVDDEDVDPEFDRRNLLKQGVHFFAKPAIQKVQSKIDHINETVDKITRRVPLIRPPGAITERQFLQACTRCDKCIHACPKDAIQRAPKKMGFLIAGSPYIDPKKIPCVMCDDLPCIPACPDGALVPPPHNDRMEVKMGYAILDKKNCQAYGDTFCQQCVIDCPIPGAIIQKDQKPIIDKRTCTGCGVCVLSCSTVNIPLAIKIKPKMVIDSQIQKKRMEMEQARIKAERDAEEKKAREDEDKASENLESPAATENENE
jgi:ferredoxin-type protein NapG